MKKDVNFSSKKKMKVYITFKNLKNMDLKTVGDVTSEQNMNFTDLKLQNKSVGNVDLYPGDVIGSGTVGTGCFLELNGTGKLNDPNYTEQWLKEGDVVEMEVDGLGTLKNTIAAEETDWSILKLKK